MKRKNKHNYPVVLSNKAIDWIITYCPSYISYDFTGYLFSIDKKKTIGCAVNLRGQFVIYSLNPDKPTLTEREQLKVLKKLIRGGFVRKLRYEDPFPEYERYSNIPFDARRALIVHDFFFSVIE